MNLFNWFRNSNTRTDDFTQPIQVVDDFNGFKKLFNSFKNEDKKYSEWVAPSENPYRIFETTPEINLVVNKGANLFSNGSWRLYNLEDEEIINHPVLDLLKKPNTMMSKNEFLEIVYKHYALFGNSISFLNYALSTSELPTTITPLDIKRVALLRSGKYTRQISISDIILKYQLIDKYGRVEDNFEVDEILHLKNVNPEDFLKGNSPLRALHMPISNIRSGYGYVNADFSKKGAMGAVAPKMQMGQGGMIPTSVNSEEMKELERQYSEQTHGTADDKSKVIIARTPIEYISFGSAIKDHLILENREIDFKRIIDAFGLNESFFSFLKQSTFSNQANGEKQGYQNGIIPVADLFSSEINDALKLVDRFSMKVRLSYDHVSCFQEDEKEKSLILINKVNAFEKLIANGVAPERALEITNLSF